MHHLLLLLYPVDVRCGRRPLRFLKGDEREAEVLKWGGGGTLSFSSFPPADTHTPSRRWRPSSRWLTASPWLWQRGLRASICPGGAYGALVMASPWPSPRWSSSGCSPRWTFVAMAVSGCARLIAVVALPAALVAPCLPGGLCGVLCHGVVWVRRGLPRGGIRAAVLCGGLHVSLQRGGGRLPVAFEAGGLSSRWLVYRLAGWLTGWLIGQCCHVGTHRLPFPTPQLPAC